MNSRGKRLLSALCLGLILISGPRSTWADGVLFLSTQLTPVSEATKMRQNILKDYSGTVQFQPNDNRLVYHQLAIGSDSTRVRPGLLGGLHGDFVSLADEKTLSPVDDLLKSLKDRKIVSKFLELGRMGSDTQVYIPWMQATYIMAANRKALKYLPPGVDINRLTYEQLITWGSNLKKETGDAKIGLPLSRDGLIHRFIQGYLYPSYTEGTVRDFNSPQAHDMWSMMQRLWSVVTSRSLSFSHMQTPLLTEEVWVAWDHTARLKKALDERPNDFIIFPAPAGPAGRGFMVVLAGLAVPKMAPDRAAAESLIDYLTRPDTQIKTLENVGFFPIVETGNTFDLPAGLEALKNGVDIQASAADAKPTLLPTGLGEQGRNFNAVYVAAFSRIVLRGRDIKQVLDKQAKTLRDILSDTQAHCWPPDAPST